MIHFNVTLPSKPRFSFGFQTNFPFAAMNQEL